MKVIITIPAYNEEKTLPSVSSEIKKVMGPSKYKYEILVVDDGSIDKTSKVAKSMGAVVFRNSHNIGLAETFKVEMKKCLELKADVIVHTDADGQYQAKDILRLLNKIEEGYNLVLGSRFMGTIESMPFSRRVGNILLSKAISMLIKTRITDSTTGFRAFTSEVAQGINFINTFTYTHEQLIRAAKQKFRIIEIPIHARKTRKSRLFKNPVEYAIKAWLNILRIYRDYEPIKFFGLIGLLFFLVGFGLGVWIIINILQTGGVEGIPRVILSALFIMTGIQIILFGFLADMKRAI